MSISSSSNKHKLTKLHHTVETLFAEPIHEHFLDNGLKIIIKEDPSFDIASVQAWVKTGSIYEDQYLGSGISHFVEHMLFKGTTTRTYKQISDETQAAGGFANAYTTFDRTVYHIDLPSQKINTALDILSNILFNSIFDPNEVDKERSVILREIEMDLDDPHYQLSRALFTTIFQKHPYRYPVIGDKELFLQLTRDHLYQYYKERYTPNNMVLVVVGNVTTETLLPQIITYFGKHSPNFLRPLLIPDEPKQLTFRQLTKTSDVKLTRGVMSFNIPSLNHPDTPALTIFSHLLGSGDSSHLWQTLREKQRIVDSISTSLWNPTNAGLFWIHYTCEPEKAHLVPDAIEKEIKNFVQHTLKSKQLEKTIRQALVGEINGRRTMSGQAARLGIADVVIGDLKFSKIFIKKLQSVSIKEIQNLYSKYFYKENQTHVLLEAPKKSVRKPSHKTCLAIEDFEVIQLDTGATLLLQPFPKLPKISLHAVFQGGPLYETESTAGITYLLSSLLTKDTKKRNAAQVADAIEQAAGVFNEFAGNNSFGLSLEVLETDFPLAIDLLEQALLYPKLLKKEFDLERDSQIADIKRELDDVFDQGFRALRKQFFGAHPYAHSSLGTIEALERLKLPELKKHYQHLLSSKNAVFAVSGAFKKSAIIGPLTKLLKKIPSTPFNKKECILNPNTNNSIEIPLDKEQAVVFEACPAPGIKEPEADVAEVFCELLNGMSSQLFIEVREKHNMAYYVGASQMVGVHTGMFYLYAGTNKENYSKVFDFFDREINRIKNGRVLPDELERCKTHLKSAHLMGLQNTSGRALRAGLDYLFGFPANYWRTYLERVDAVSLEAIQQFAQNFLKEDYRLRLSIGDLK